MKSANTDQALPNIFIFGSGRCGTSMVASFFRKTAHYKGAKPVASDVGNPLGYYEDDDVDWLNEKILEPYQRALFQYVDSIPNFTPGKDQITPMPLPPDLVISCTPRQQAAIRVCCSHQPFCYKDSRLPYTLHLWRPFAGNCRYICVFRHPTEVVFSYAALHRDAPLYHDVAISINRHYEWWRTRYEWIFKHYATTSPDQWIFLQYARLFEEPYRRAFEARLGFELNFSTVNPEARHHFKPPNFEPPPEVVAVYHKLLELDDLCPAGR